MDITKNKKPTVLVLGATGLLGYHCAKVFQHKYRVVQTYNTHPIDQRYCVKLDLSQPSDQLNKLLSQYRPDVVVNTVAYVTVDGCEEKPYLAKRLNADFVGELVDCMQELQLQNSHLIQISSDSVYGKRAAGKASKWRESDHANPLSVYAASKLDSEKEAFRHVGKSSVLRTAFYGINPHSEKSLLWWIINNARNGVVMDGWENVFFSPVSARTLSNVIYDMVEAGIQGLFNVGSVDSCSKYSFVDAVCQELEIDSGVNKITCNHRGSEVIRPEYSVLDSSKLAGVLNWDCEWRKDLADYMSTLPKNTTL